MRRVHIYRCRRDFSRFMRVLAQMFMVGLDLHNALDLCVKHLNRPLAFEIQVMLNEVWLGLSREEAINNFARRIGGAGASDFGAVVNASHETGASISQMLIDIARENEVRQSQNKTELFWYFRTFFLLAIFSVYLNPMIGVVLATVLVLLVAAAGLQSLVLLALRVPVPRMEAPPPKAVTIQEAEADAEVEITPPNRPTTESFAELLADESVSEIVFNGREEVFVTRAGVKKAHDFEFTSRAEMSAALSELLAEHGHRLDERMPVLSAAVGNDHYIDAVLEPLVLERFVKIRRVGASNSGRSLVVDSDNEQLIEFLKLIVANGARVLVSTGAGVSREDIISFLLAFTDPDRRIALLESQPRVKVSRPDTVKLYPRPANIEGNHAVSFKELSQTMWNLEAGIVVIPDALETDLTYCLSQAVRHDTQLIMGVAGSSARFAIEDIAGSQPQAAARAFDFVVQVKRASDGTVRFTQVTELWGTQGNTICTQDIFVFNEIDFDKNRKVIGETRATGVIPSFAERLEQRGVCVPRAMFSPRER